jgi:hypothetical protein
LCDELGTALIEDDEMDVGGSALNTVLKSLTKIRAAKSGFPLPSSAHSTPAALLAQIKLCDVLLDEIQSISCSLDRRVETSTVPSRRPMATRLYRGTAHQIAPRRPMPGRTKQRK